MIYQTTDGPRWMFYTNTKHVFFRNFILFCLAVILCVAGLVIFLSHTDKVFEERQNVLFASNALLAETEDFSKNLNNMLESHVNYSIGKSFDEFEEFKTAAEKINANIEALVGMVAGDESQEGRIANLSRNFDLLKEQLDAQTNDIQTQNGANVR